MAIRRGLIGQQIAAHREDADPHHHPHRVINRRHPLIQRRQMRARSRVQNLTINRAAAQHLNRFGRPIPSLDQPHHLPGRVVHILQELMAHIAVAPGFAAQFNVFVKP